MGWARTPKKDDHAGLDGKALLYPARDGLANLIRKAIEKPKRRIKTKPTRGSVERRIKAKTVRGRARALRSNPR